MMADRVESALISNFYVRSWELRISRLFNDFKDI